VEELKKKYSPV